jgi:alpha-L-fucosidase
MTRLLAAAAASVMLLWAVPDPAPYGPVPSARQLRWHQLEMYAFVHFTVNTFTDKEWGYGDEPESTFNPTDFDAGQIVRAVKDAGLKGLILTAKHHDGFCLWPSRFTEHSVKRSPWRDGKGDVVREVADACRRNGILFGLYLSPWDRNHADYARPEYLTYYRNQLRELLAGYGPLFEMWFDGANGGDGYYGGAREKRKIDNRTYYDWANTWNIVRSLQPDTCMFSDAGPDVRWVGNEKGIAGDPCWGAIKPEGTYPGGADETYLNRGDRDGTVWRPAEVDVSIRPGWFYHASEDAKVKTPEQLLKIYFESVGRGANLILNIPPDRRGRIHERDAESLREWRRILAATFERDLARGAKASGPSRAGDTKFAPANVIDGDRATYWATDDNATTPEMQLEFSAPVKFSVVRLREYLPLGQRIDAFALDAWQDGAWREFARATSIGNQRLVRLESPVTAMRVRLRITEARACPALSELSVF